MSVAFKTISALAICVLLFLPLYGAQSVNKTVKTGIILNARSFTAACNDEFYVTAAGRKFKLSKGMVNISAAGDNSVMMEKYKIPLPLKIESSKGIVFANGNAYRGYFTVVKAGKKINVINVLDIEDYIKGVLPKEAGPDWPLEALKAQAVISRTYTAANLGRHAADGFDMCNTTHCQVYGGAGAESLSCNKAVAETYGEVVTYEGKFAQTVFHANCGGHTEDPKYVWGWTQATPEYLKGVKCGYCGGDTHFRWEKTLDESFIREKLSAYKIGKIKSIKVKGVTPAGSAKEIQIVHSKGTFTMNAYKFRTAVDAWQIKSTTFDGIKKDGDKFTFKGRGWGHKVGLCQWGAKGMAEKGKKYKYILEYYYPKTKIEKIEYNNK